MIQPDVVASKIFVFFQLFLDVELILYSVIGKIFGIDGSSVRRLIIKRFDEMKKEKMMTRKRKQDLKAIPIRKRYGIRFLSAEHLEYLLDPDILQNWIGLSLK